MSEHIYAGKNFLFVFKIDISDKKLKTFANNVEQRRKKILSILGLDAKHYNVKKRFI